MLFPITTVSLIGCLALTYSRDGRRSALLLALSAWAVGVLLMSVPIFAYKVDYSVVADAFVAACLVVTTAAYLMVRQKTPLAPQTDSDRHREIQLATFLGVLGIIGSALLLLDAQTRGTQLSVSYLLQNLTFIRSTVFENLAESAAITPTALVGTYLGSCSFLSVIAAARLGRAGGPRILVLGATNLLLIGVVSLLIYGGRGTLLYAVFVMLISVYVSGKRFAISPKAILMTGVLLVGAWYFSVSWLGTREGNVNAEAVLLGTQRAEYRPWIAPLARHDEAVGLGLISVGYFSSPLPTLAFYVEQESLPGPFYGGYSYPLPARVAAKLNGTYRPSQWNDTREEVFRPLESAGYFGNVWSTWLRDLLIDFGYVGAVLFCGAFGAFMAWARNRFELTGALRYHYLEVFACFTLAFGAFTSLLWLSFLSNAFFIAVALTIGGRGRSATRSTVKRLSRRGAGSLA